MIKIVTILLLLCYSVQATTYYVADSTNGDITNSWGASAASDGNAGTSWAASWSSITKTNTAISAGDTVEFSTGIWRGNKLIPVAGTFADRTAYACSSFADTNFQGAYHFAEIWGSTQITGWTVHSGNVYKAFITSPEDTMINAAGKTPNLWNASLAETSQWMRRRASLAGIVAAGEWFWNGSDSLYAWVSGDGDPDNSDMEFPRHSTPIQMHVNETGWVGQDYVTFYGFTIKYGTRALFEGNLNMMEVSPYDSVFIDHCKLSHISYDQGSNPALIYSGWSADSTFGGSGHYNRIRSCSLSYAYAINPTTFALSGNKGSGIDHYAMSDYTVDSNVFYGYFKYAAIYWKAAQFDPSPWCSNVVIKYNTFNNTENGFGIEFFGWARFDSVYGNIFNGLSLGIKDRRSHVGNAAHEAGPGQTVYMNNTFIDCTKVIRWSNSTGDGSNYDVLNEFKYNVIYQDATDLALDINSYSTTATDSSEWVFYDSNLYYIRTTGSYDFTFLDVSKDTTEWKALGMDAHSTLVTDPSFNNYGAGDFTRPSASGEMNQTIDGKTITIFGALQNAAAAATRQRMKGYK